MGKFTTFAEELRSRGISKLYICGTLICSTSPNRRQTSCNRVLNVNISSMENLGLATDYCVCETAIDGADQGFSVVLLEDLTVRTCNMETFAC